MAGVVAGGVAAFVFVIAVWWWLGPFGLALAATAGALVCVYAVAAAEEER